MPLHGKIVVIKRSGGDGTEFPLTATCLFGRKPDCDIRIQLPQVSKEHCRIDLNENKEVVLTNLSSVNPTCVNGEALQQSERLKHGDVITIIDRSFRFEYPPAPTPKKRSSTGGKTETLKVLKDQQVGDTVTTETGGKKISEVSTGPHLKDGTNNDNIQRSLEKTMEVDPQEDPSLLQNKTASPFNDLYQMIKKSLDVKTPRKSSVSLLQTPSSKLCTPKPVSVRKSGGKPVISSEDKSTPKKNEAKVSSGADETKEEAEKMGNGTPKSAKKQRKSFEVPSTVMAGPEAGNGAKSEAVSPQKRNRSPPQRFTVGEVIEQVSTQTPKSPVRRRSKEATPAKPAVSKEQERQAVTSPKTKASPKNSGKLHTVKEASNKRKSGELAADLPTPQMKRKRVSFGGQLSPELFDKRLPPDSPLRKGATPRRSLSLYRPKNSLLRRASVIGLLQEHPSPKKSPGAQASPKTPSPAKKSPKSKSPSPKAETPAKKSPKSKSPSPKAQTPAKKSPKSKSPSPKAETPAKKSPKSKSPSPKAASANKMETPKATKQTPTVQGRFSVSRISTPSPVAEDAVTDQVPLTTVTPKIPLKRKSMKSTSRKSIAKSAVKVLRRSGISRASIKAMNSYADMVKFGQTKVQLAVPAKMAVPKKTMKKTVSKLQTPARKLIGHVSTGHANSPVTIVVGRAHKQKVVQPTGAAPRLVTNIVLLKKNMKMDEDLTGISEMYKTPVNVRKRRSVINGNSAMKTPAGALGTSVVEPSVLNTPEEPDEMMVSPMSTVKDGMYNSEAVRRLLDVDQECSLVCDVPAEETHSDGPREQECTDVKRTSVTTPKQKPELPEGLTGVKRIMKTPRQKAEPVEDLRGRLLKTPKQKPEQQECLTGVKRLMKTPRQKAEPVEDLRGNVLKTPKQKPKVQECLTGVKQIFETPQWETEPLKDVQGKLLKTSKAPEAVEAVDAPVLKEESEDPSEMTDMMTPCMQSAPLETKEVEDQNPLDCGLDVAKELDFAREEPQDDVPSDVTDNVPQVEMEKEADTNEVVDDHTEEVPSKHNHDEASEATKTISQATVDENVPVEEPEMGTVDEAAPEELTVVAVHEAVPKEPAVDAVDEAAPEEPTVDEAVPEEPSLVAVDEAVPEEQPKLEKKSVRGRRVKTAESKMEDKQEAAEHSEDPVISAPVRGRRGNKTEATAPPTVRQTTRGRNAKTTESREVEPAVEESLPSKIATKPKRGRNAKKASDDQAEIVEEIATESEAPSAECLPEGETATCKEPETDATIVQKKSVRGRRVKVVESKPAEDRQEVPEHPEDPVISAPVRGRRGKKTEVAAPPTVRHTTRGRNAKSQECTSNVQSEMEPEKAVETPVTDISTEAEIDQTSTENTHQEEIAPPAEEVVVKPVRGRKAKQTPVEPLQPEPEKVVSEELLTTDAEPQKSIPAVGKPRRGRKTKADTVEQNEVKEDSVTVEAKQESQPPVRAKRGRNARPEEEKLENSKTNLVEITKSQEPVKKGRRTRRAEQDHEEPSEEVQTTEKDAPEKAEAPVVAEPEKLMEQAAVAAKPRRGGRKAKQDTENETPVESAEVQEVPTASTTDKPKRGRRGKQVAEEVDVTPVVPEEKPDLELETEEQSNVEPEAPVVKASRARGAKKEVSQVIPAKRARRGAAPHSEENNTESTTLFSESAPASIEPTKRGRRTAAKPTADDATVTSEQAEPIENSSSAVEEDTKKSKRSVKWKTGIEVFEIPNPTPVKAVRGRKSKLGDHIDTESQNVSKDASKTEEKDLSETVVEARPVKRARRGAKIAVVTADKEESTSEVPSVEAETQPKTRRGRSAKK